MQDTAARDRPEAGQRGVVALLGELGGAGLDLAHNTAKLAASEAPVVLRRLALRAGVFIGAVVFTAMGLVLVLGAGAMLLAQSTAIPMWAALALIGGVAGGVGVLVAMRMLRRLCSQDLAFPATMAEFQADVEALRRRPRATSDDGL